MTRTLTFTEELVVEVCWCGMHHAVPTGLRNHMNAQHENGEKQIGIHCPLGHVWVFSGKPAIERERKIREQAEARAQAIQDQLDSEKRSHAASKAQLTKIRKRTTNGLCPVPGCHRSGFTQVKRHLASKHPDWLAEHVHEVTT